MAGQITTPEIRMINLPQGREAGWISYIIDEQDCVIFGEALFHKLGGVFPNEHENITSKLFTAYSELRTRQGIFPSPFMDTYLNLQRPAAFDAILIEPENNRHPRVAVVFLHGFMGNVTAQCWEIARAVDRFGALTVCPSAGWQGEWRKPQGEAILRATFSYLREQGFQQFYLGGFSNGGFGISSLASRLGNEEGLLGLFFIDGISDGAGIVSLGLPVLILQGAEDERMPAPAARRTAEIIGNLGTYVELDSDHFVIMKRPHLVQSALAEWLKIHAADK
jgi:pimeloyl-ACP methyl ester carboxylesterase